MNQTRKRGGRASGGEGGAAKRPRPGTLKDLLSDEEEMLGKFLAPKIRRKGVCLRNLSHVGCSRGDACFNNHADVDWAGLTVPSKMVVIALRGHKAETRVGAPPKIK
jgi:hypothetical protein